jgi:ABC-type ATPase with predicted acetyltransferase domain
MIGSVVGREIPKFKHRWFGTLDIEANGQIYTIYTAGVAKWLFEGDKVELIIKSKPKEIKGNLVLFFDDYELYRIYNGEKVKVWPYWVKEVRSPRYSIFGNVLYEYHIRAREAVFESDFEAIAELEQYHYASEKEKIALWRCDNCGELIEANIKQNCSNCGSEDVHIVEIKGSTPASRFLILELVNREEFEPRIIAYVRIDPPIPLMHRRLPNGEVVRNVRELVFPKEWFHPVYSPELVMKRIFKKLRRQFSKKIARHKLWEIASWEAMRRSDTACARIARVVVHPDYRSDGIGMLAVKLAIEWIEKRRVPEMKKRKHLVETIAQMARYNPFFEKVGFRYVWDTASGRPVLYYPLTKEAEAYLQKFFETDEYAREHKGRLCVSRYGKVEELGSPIVFRNVSKVFENHLDVSKLKKDVRELLEAFGVRHRIIERQVIRNASFEIKPKEIVVVVGASGAGKTTLLRLILGAVAGIDDERFKPTSGEIEAPKAKVGVLIPQEFEPSFGEESILEHVYAKTGDLYCAVEVLNKAGLSDAVLYRAKYSELSTGQKERAKLASILAEKPSLILIDEFSAHLDNLTAMRVARKIGQIARQAGITLVAITHRKEVIDALEPDKVIYVGYGITKVEERS